MINESVKDIQLNVKTTNPKSSKLLSTIAIAAGISAPGIAQAELIITDVDHTHVDGTFSIDIDGLPGFEIDINIVDPEAIDYAFVSNSLKSSGSVMFSTEGKFARMFSEGETVDASTFGSSSGSADLYANDLGNWGTIGAHGFLGFAFDDGTQNGLRYGWLELTRGSVSVGQIGLQDSYNTGANAPTSIPEPGTLLFLASGSLGLLGLRRRNQLQA